MRLYAIVLSVGGCSHSGQPVSARNNTERAGSLPPAYLSFLAASGGQRIGCIGDRDATLPGPMMIRDHPDGRSIAAACRSRYRYPAGT